MAWSSISQLNCNFDEEKIRKFVMDRGLIPKTIRCQKCRNILNLEVPKLRFRCQKMVGNRQKCGYQASARNLTFFSGTHLKLMTIMNIVSIFLWSPRPRTQVLLRETGGSSKTVHHWESVCRDVCKLWCLSNSQPLGGPNVIVEIDEVKLGKRKYNRGRLIKGQWVFGGCERFSGKCFLVPVERRDRATLLNLIKRYIVPGSIIVSDCWKAYDCLTNEGFEHYQINHSRNFVDRNDPGVHTQNIERLWRDLRSSVPKYGKSVDDFTGYLAEFIFKRTNKEDLLIPFLDAVSLMFPGLP